MRSPSSRAKIRMIPCIAGCAGPTLRSMSRVSRSAVVSDVSCDSKGIASWAWLIDRADQRLALPDRIIFAQRMALKALVHEDAFQGGMSAEGDSKHVPDFALQPVGSRPQRREGIDFGIRFRHRNHQAQPMLVGCRVEVIDHSE